MKQADERSDQTGLARISGGALHHQGKRIGHDVECVDEHNNSEADYLSSCPLRRTLLLSFLQPLPLSLLLLTPPAIAVLKISAGLLADRVLGEVRRFHPLVGFGRWASLTESSVRQLLPDHRLSGLLAWLLAVLPWLAATCVLRTLHPLLTWLVDIGLLYLALGGRSLIEHVEAVATPLAAGDLAQARERVSWIVSRDTGAMGPDEVARAATESALENGNDAIFGALFCFAIGGGIGVLLYRLANTLDAMWGYRNERYLRFGWAAARIDDVLNFFPARLTALSYALLGNTGQAMRCWRSQAGQWISPNAGAVMAAGAGALGIRLGGISSYHGEVVTRPTLGCGRAPDANSLTSAIALIQRSTLLWYALIIFLALGSQLLFYRHA